MVKLEGRYGYCSQTIKSDNMSDYALSTNDRIKLNCQKVRAAIEEQCDPMDGACLLGNLMDLKALGGLMSETIALANSALRDKQVELMKRDDPQLERVIELFGKGAMKTWIETECKRELQQVEYCTFLDKRLSYAIEALRTAVSHLKEEMNRERFGN
jgi:hypothetical protein